MAAPSVKILSPFFKGEALKAPKRGPSLKASDYKSMDWEPPSATSWPYSMSSAYSPIRKGGKVIARTANNRFETSEADFKKYGFFSQVDDYKMDSWRANSRDFPPMRNHDIPVIPKMPNLAFIEGASQLRQYFPNSEDTKAENYVTPEIINAVDINKVGYFVSKQGNLKQALRDFMFDDANRFTEISKEWALFLEGKGRSVKTSGKKDIIGLGVENDLAGEGYLAGYYPGKGYIVRETNLYRWAQNIIERYGLKGRDAVDAMQEYILMHEFGHRLGVDSESEQGQLQNEFYSKMADKYRGTRKGMIYSAIAEQGKDYAEYHRRGGNSSHHHGAGKLEILAAKFNAEARAIGIRGNSRSKYVNARLQDTYGVLLDSEPTHENYESESEGLDRIVEEDSEKPERPREKGKVILLEERRNLRRARDDDKDPEKDDRREGAERSGNYDSRKILEYKSMSDANRSYESAEKEAA